MLLIISVSYVQQSYDDGFDETIESSYQDMNGVSAPIALQILSGLKFTSDVLYLYHGEQFWYFDVSVEDVQA